MFRSIGKESGESVESFLYVPKSSKNLHHVSTNVSILNYR